jgi:ketosteroid isomerase-like protein
MSRRGAGPLALLERLLPAVNDHNLEALVSCFVDDYVNENPAHPQREFRGKEQVRRNWAQIFGGVPDVHARVLRYATQGDTLWTEWDMWGTRRDGGAFQMRGVFIFGVEQGMAKWARMFLEPVEEISGDTDTAVSQVAGDETTAAVHPPE